MKQISLFPCFEYSTYGLPFQAVFLNLKFGSIGSSYIIIAAFGGDWFLLIKVYLLLTFCEKTNIVSALLYVGVW